MERQHKIIQAGLKEFATYGYDETSTNELAKTAEMTKPLLFHYIESKKKFYLYLYDYSAKLVIDKFKKFVHEPDTDLLENLRQSYRWKLELMKLQPLEYSFLQMHIRKPPKKDSMEELKEIKKEYEQLALNIYSKEIDRTLFRPELDVDKSLELIMWAIYGYGEKIVKKSQQSWDDFDFEEVGREYDSYIDELKKAFYVQKDER
jgi:AcrR family transcriptional regulator